MVKVLAVVVLPGVVIGVLRLVILYVVVREGVVVLTTGCL